jgi:protein-disulfide isomerase
VANKLTKDEMREQRRAEWKQEAEKKSKEEKIKKYGIWSVVALIVIAVGFVFYKAATTTSTPTNDLIKAPAVETRDIQTGPKDAKATLIEYSDFQCPTCALYYPLVKQLTDEYKGRINFVYRIFPLENVHPNAFASAQAAYAAHLQGKFWEMEDLLFTNQTKWAELADPKQTFVGYANQLKLDTAKFEADYDSDATKKEVSRQRDSATSSLVQGTPTFFLNGQLIDNPQGYDAFKKLIDEALK